MENKKWYTGLTTTEIVKELSRISHNAVAYAKRKEFDESEQLEKEFDKKFKEVIPAIVDTKTEYWSYRNHNNVYDEWDKCQRDVWTIKRGMENDIFLTYKEFNML